MINTNELMQGNVLYCLATGKNEEVVGFDSEYIYINAITLDYLTPEDFNPIELTENILDDLEFKEKGGLFLKELLCISKKNGVFYHSPTNIILKYVHQLQNLYFLLTNNKLIFNDTNTSRT